MSDSPLDPLCLAWLRDFVKPGRVAFDTRDLCRLVSATAQALGGSAPVPTQAGMTACLKALEYQRVRFGPMRGAWLVQLDDRVPWP
jgi:hypothetical protein